ncbi:DUF4102 domain-containing protein, partial [Escherichia coli]|nr:DUF4102 domain-containing protein [Escherichia coli]
MKLYPSTKKANQPLTKSVIAESCARALHEGRSVESSDSKLTGLKIIASPASPGEATFIVRKSICGENIYKRIGRYPELSIAEAREIASEIITDLEESAKKHGKDYRKIKKMDFNRLLKKYGEEVLNKGIKRSARTDLSKIHKYLLPRLGDKKIADMTEADIVAYLHDLDLKPATRNRHLALIKAVFTWAIRMGYTSCSPARYIKALPEVTSDRRAMDDSQLQQWMEVCERWRNGKPDHEALALLMFLALTGLRLGETRHLRLEDVEWSRKVITLRHTKNGKLRRVPVCDKAFVLLTEQRQYLGDEG